jgi:putative ABC transport system permease protein
MSQPENGALVSEFPTAPRDSFFVANAAYVAARTGSDAVGTFLVDTGGRDTTRVATDLRALLGTSATVTDVADARSRVGSSRTSVDLAALTRVELGFALVLAAAAGGLVSFLGLTERRRSFDHRAARRDVAAVARAGPGRVLVLRSAACSRAG